MHPQPLAVESGASLGSPDVLGARPDDIVVVPPHGEQILDRVLENRVQHGGKLADRDRSARIITVTKPPARCAWCSAVIPTSGGPGRPRRFCKRSHRQRHYEARRLATATGLAPDEVLIGRDLFDEWRDQLYLLEAALEDAQQDLGGAPSLREYTEAFQVLYDAAVRLRTFRLEARALGAE